MTITDDNLARAAARARQDPAFFGHLVAKVEAAESIDDAEVCRRLGCDARALNHLCLCLVPAPGRFDADCRQVADHCGVDVAAVRRLAGGDGS